MTTQKRYVEESLLMGGCPACGTEVNREFVEDTIDRIVRRAKKEAREEVRREERAFILNILDGIDIADGECNTKAIRYALSSRVV